MKIITLWQPWATFIALDLKRFETRSWGTGYRGKLAIHAAKRPIDLDGECTIDRIFELTDGKVPRQPCDYPLGYIVAVADLVNCPQMDSSLISRQAELELAVGSWQPGRFAWQLENIIALSNPIPYRGSQGLRDVRPEALKILMELTNGE